MKYTTTFKDVETGLEYYVSECYTDRVSGDLRALVLVGINHDNVVEASVDYEGIMVRQVSYISGSFMDIGVMEFNERFVEME